MRGADSLANKAFLSPEFAIFLSLCVLFVRLEKAVSVAEKYADNAIGLLWRI